MDYKNILEGTRPFFQGLPLPLSSPNAISNPGGTSQSSMSLPLPLPHQNSQQTNNSLRMKYEEGLGATLSQMYNTVSPTLRIPASSSSPKTGPSPGVHSGISPGREREHHLALRGGSSNVPSLGSSVLNIPNASSLPSNTAPRTNSASQSTNPSGPTTGVRRESPLDLSVKTVRQSADSSTNNPTDGACALAQSQGQLGSGNNCVVNSSGVSGTRSLSSSGASTPNNSHSGGGGGNNTVSSVIAAVANSTTGREKELGGSRPPSHPHQQQQPIVPHQAVAGTPPGHAPPPLNSGTYPQNHHLFGHYHHPASPVLNIPGTGHSSGGDTGKIYNNHQYLQHNSYRTNTPTSQAPVPGSHNFQSPVATQASSSSNPSLSASGSTTSTTNTTSTAQHQQQPSRPSSVIPPYNPPQPNFGLGAYHHHHQQPQGQQLEAHHHPYHPHPYTSYHIPPGPGPGQSAHAYYASHYGSSSAGHLPPQQSHSSQSQQHSNSNAAGNNNSQTLAQGPGSASVVPTNQRNSANHNQRNSNHHESVAQSAPASAYPQNNTSNGKGSTQNVNPPQVHYGHTQAHGPSPNASSSPYTQPYPQYYPTHLSEGTRQPVPPQSPITRPPAPINQSRQIPYSHAHASYPQPTHYGNTYPGIPAPVPPTSYPSSHHYPPSPMVSRSPHAPSQIQNYYPYLHPGTPRPIPPPMSTNQQLPSGYHAYPTHLTGPRPPAPHPQQTQAQQPPAGSYPPNSIQPPLNVPTPKQNSNSPVNSKSTTIKGSGGRSGTGAKSGEKRKNLLNLLRNSLETRIHEKQEKEKFQFNHQTWNFHGKKYHNPLPPPQQVGPLTGSSGGGGSILTGLSHHSTNSENQNNVNSLNGTGSYPGLFGINQRSNFIEGQGALSPNTDNSLQRIRTKAEKKQVFPNLLSQIEQENAHKHQQQAQGPLHQQQIGEKYKTSNNSSAKTSVFDFEEDEEESKGNFNLSRRSPGHSISPVASVISTTVPPKRRGSKKFTSKLNKWIPPIGIPSVPPDKNSTKSIPTLPPVLKAEVSVVSIPSSSTTSKIQPSTNEPRRVPAIDNMDEFWATCDSFLDDLSANPMTIKSRRGGLWAKLKSNTTPKEGKKGKRRRLRRPSAEVDVDFQIEEDEEGKSDELGDENEIDDISDSESISDNSEVSALKSSSGSVKITKPEQNSGGESELSENGKNGESGSGKVKESSPVKRKGSTIRSPRRDITPPPKKKSKRDNSFELKGRKVGKRTLRERRAGSLIGKSVGSELGEGRSSGESDGDESDVSLASFSISSEDSVSESESSSSEDSELSVGGSVSDASDKQNEGSLDSKGSLKKVKVRSELTKEKTTTSRRSTRNSQRGRKDKRKEEVKGRKRKLRPTRTCAKGKLKEISGESEEERGSSGEEWIMRGELGKRKREKRRIVYGDGSEFRRPGWEEELIDFKKKLRMPSKLIRVAKPSSLSSIPSGKGELDPGVAVSPAKSTKENKSPMKSSPIEEKDEELGENKIKSKGRSPKKGEKEEVQIGSTPEKGSSKESKLIKSPKGIKGKKKLDGLCSTTEHSLSSPSKVAVVMVEKSIMKVKGKMEIVIGKGKGIEKGKSMDEIVSIHVNIKEERDKNPPLLPTPGPAGLKFNKKMSIKSVFGVDVTPSIELSQSPVPPKKILRRNKFKSGFDYIRKKKKAVSTPDGSIAPPPIKRPKVIQEKNVTEEDVQNEFRGWVLNKGLGETVLHRAARLGYPDVAAYALEHDVCSPNCKDNAGYSPLHETCMKGNLEVAKILLAYGANPSQAAPGGIRPLHEACENGHIELVRLLISYGADPLLATYAGQTPLELAEHHKPVKRLLEQHIKDVQGREEKKWEFRGTGKWSEETYDNGFDVTADPPLQHDTVEIGEGFEFEASELPLPSIYMLKEDVPYVLLQDLINFLGLPKDRILKSHPGAELVELNSNDFLEDVHCRQLLGVKFRLNLSSDLLVLIKYDDVIKKMLNIESCFIK